MFKKIKPYINYILGILLITSFLFIFYDFSRPIPDPITIIEGKIDEPVAASAQEDKINITIDGEVQKPGTYQLAPGSLIVDAINLAGGLTNNANLDLINFGLGDTITNEQNIFIPSQAVVIDENIIVENAISINNFGLININQASLDELTTLNGIGPVTAQKIIDYRLDNPFDTIEEIKEVKGIGDGIFGKIKDEITI